MGLGLGLAHYVLILAYLGFWVMSIVSLTGRPLYGFYYFVPFLPYRTLRDHFLDYPLGSNVLTILIVAVILGAFFKGKRLPSSMLYITWLVFGIYLYFSMWLGSAMGNAPAPLWLNDLNFVTWKDYMLIPLTFVAASLVVEDRKAVRNVVIITAISVLFIDRSCLMESMSHTWTNFDENKRSGGPLGFGSNQTAAYLAQFAMFYWGLVVFIKRFKAKLLLYGLVGTTIFTAMYTFSRAGYLAILFSTFVLALVKDRKLLVVLVVFLFTWQVVVPTAVRERISMTQSSGGQLDQSAQARVDLWQDAEDSIARSPIFGSGYATYQFGQHAEGLKDTHNWYVKVMVETGVIGLMFAFALIVQMFAAAVRLFRQGNDPLYRGVGLGLLLATCACVVANCFGDRWTYLEITAPLWVLVGVALRATELANSTPDVEQAVASEQDSVNPYLAYR